MMYNQSIKIDKQSGLTIDYSRFNISQKKASLHLYEAFLYRNCCCLTVVVGSFLSDVPGKTETKGVIQCTVDFRHIDQVRKIQPERTVS